jgi:hypothetical protein
MKSPVVTRPPSDERKRRDTLPLCRLTPFIASHHTPCSGPATWSLTVTGTGLKFHACDAHLAPSIRRVTEQGHIEVRSLEAGHPTVTSGQEARPGMPEHPNRAGVGESPNRPGLYSHVHLPHGEERLTQARGGEIDGPPHCPDAATPNLGGLGQGLAETPARPK